MVIGGVFFANREVPKAGLLVRDGKVYNRKHSTSFHTKVATRKQRIMKEYTARSFAMEYRVSSVSARRHLNRLVKEGKAKSERKPLRVNLNGKEVETKKTVTTYIMR